MHNDIKELLDIVRDKLDTPTSSQQHHHHHVSSPKESEQNFWNDMLQVLQTPSNVAASPPNIPSSTINPIITCSNQNQQLVCIKTT